MKRALYPFLILILISMACTLGTPAKSTVTPVPTQEEATATAEVTQESGETPTPANDTLVSTVNDAEKATVQIITEGTYEQPDFGSFSEVHAGSGFLIDPTGVVVTNNHVVTGAARIKVFFSGDTKSYNARVLGASECSDLAVIKIDGSDFPYMDWYPDTVDLGLKVYSLGYPLGDPEFTRHQGGVSKRKESLDTSWANIEGAIEHDAIINPGNSGGPLVTDEGQVVGVNYAALKSNDMYYAISANEAKTVVADLQDGKSVTAIGINGEAFISDDASISGIWVYSVASGSPADKTGIQPGDVITELEGIPVARQGTMQEYCDVLRAHTSKDVLKVKVLRYKTKDILEGQINGREMQIVSNGSGDTTGGNTGGNTGSNPTATPGSNPTSTPGSNATGTPAATTTSTPGGNTGAITATPGVVYFTDEFDGGLSGWGTWVAAGDKSKNFVDSIPGRLKISLPSSETYAYVRNMTYSYKDVLVQSQFETMTGSANGVALICRYSAKGWYEWRVHTSGQYAGFYEVYRYDASLAQGGKNPFVNLLATAYNRDSMPSLDLKNGFTVNTLGLWCSGNTLAFFVNGKQVVDTATKKPVYITDKNLTEGQVGVGAMSFSNGTVRIEYDWVNTSAPK